MDRMFVALHRLKVILLQYILTFLRAYDEPLRIRKGSRIGR